MSSVVAAEGGSGDVVGGELDAISMSDDAEKSDAQRQCGDEVRRRREDVVTKELIAHGARGNEGRQNPRRARDARRRRRTSC